MAYYFAVQKKDGNYLALNIKESGYFDSPYKYEEPCACTLEEINKYTTRYTNERLIKNCLISEGILSMDDEEQQLVIIFVEDDDKEYKSWKVKGKILYKDSKNFVENTQLVLEYIIKKAEENNFTFFRELATTLPSNLVSTARITRIASLLEKSIVNGTREPELDSVTSLGENFIVNTAKILIYKPQIIPETGAVTHTDEVDPEAFHNIVSFIRDYETRLKKDKNSGYTKTRQKPDDK